jgi:hypothetical protein
MFPGEQMRNMEKIRGANRRKRRTKHNLKARNGRYPRRVNPRAKTRLIPVLAISNVPSDVLDAIDELAAGQDRSRSSFVRRELQRVVAGYRAKAA